MKTSAQIRWPRIPWFQTRSIVEKLRSVQNALRAGWANRNSINSIRSSSWKAFHSFSWICSRRCVPSGLFVVTAWKRLIVTLNQTALFDRMMNAARCRLHSVTVPCQLSVYFCQPLSMKSWSFSCRSFWENHFRSISCWSKRISIVWPNLIGASSSFGDLSNYCFAESYSTRFDWF